MADVIGHQFIIHRLRAKPVEYTVKLRHFVSNGEWMMGVEIIDVASDVEDQRRVVDDLRRAADMIEQDIEDGEKS